MFLVLKSVAFRYLYRLQAAALIKHSWLTRATPKLLSNSQTHRFWRNLAYFKRPLLLTNLFFLLRGDCLPKQRITIASYHEYAALISDGRHQHLCASTRNRYRLSISQGTDDGQQSGIEYLRVNARQGNRHKQERCKFNKEQIGSKEHAHEGS